MEKFRSKVFNLVLYDEDETHKLAIEKIKKSYDYAIILHDKDVNDEGELKKPHYHIVLRFQNAKWNTALAKELDITENYLEESRSFKKSLLYLIHFYDEDKYQYPIDEVKGPLKKRLEEFIKNDGKSESEKVLEIFDMIDEIDDHIEFSIFVKRIAIMGYWDVLRRSSSLFIRYVDEHNRNLL